MDVIDNETASRYEIHVGDQVAFAEYRKRGDVMVFTHTEVPHELEGHGIAGQLATRALDDARARHMKVVPRCPFFLSFIAKHPEYSDLVWTALNGDA
jgi:hypothetical protein